MENDNPLVGCEVKYDCRWSLNLDDDFISAFCKVAVEVFGDNYSIKYFQRKYLSNIYGPSVLALVYIDGIPSAARSLWRNDIEGKEAYQPGDTCVLSRCRRKGIFIEMTNRSVAMLPKNAVIYNFPNILSYPGYMKMGWKLIHEYGIRLFSPRRFFVEHPVKMDTEYVEWWAVGNPQLSYIRVGKNFFLVRPDRRPFVGHVIACIEAQAAKCFPKSRLLLFFYPSEIKTFYNRRFVKLHVVGKNINMEYVPTWKIDAL